MQEPEKDLHVGISILIDCQDQDFSELQKMRGVEAALVELLSTVRESIESEERIQAAENN